MIKGFLTITLGASGRIFNMRFRIVAQFKNIGASGDTKPATDAFGLIDSNNFFFGFFFFWLIIYYTSVKNF